MTLRRPVAAVVTVALVATLAALAPGGGASATVADGNPRWVQEIPGGRFHWSSPAITDVTGNGVADVVVGGLDGRVHAHDADGRPLPGWPAPAIVAGSSPTAVASSPAVGDLDGTGARQVVVGAGALEVTGQHGGVAVFERDGRRRCSFQTGDKYDQWTGGGPDGFSDGVFNAPALGDVTGDGRLEIVFGSWDHQIRVVDRHCRQLAAFDNTDTVWSAPALFDATGNGRADIFIGGDATSHLGSQSGGFFRALSYDGSPRLVQRWERRSSEAFQSASAVADINGDGRLEVVTGAGHYYCIAHGRCHDSNKVWAFDLATGNDVPGWPRSTRYNTFLSSPAIGDVTGDGRPEVVIGSFRGGRGAVIAFTGGGHPLWEVEPAGDELLSSPVLADVTGDGRNEILVGTGGRIHVLDGRTGATVGGFGQRNDLGGVAYKAAVAVGQLGPGRWAAVATGFAPGRGNLGVIGAFDIPAPGVAPAWPMFRHNARRLGIAVPDRLPAARAITGACPPGRVPSSGFVDLAGAGVHADAVECAAWWQIAQGSGSHYNPAGRVTRAQMASFVARLVDETGGELPEDPPERFGDIGGDAFAPHRHNINRLAAAGIVAGRTETTYDPGGLVTRGQMATFLIRAYQHRSGTALPLTERWFLDLVPPHADNVDRAASAGLATGFPNGTYRPGDPVRRDQMASFLARTLDLLVAQQHTTPPDRR
jgi:hypothetical protein